MSYDYETETVFVKHEYFYLWAWASSSPPVSIGHGCKDQQQSMRQLIGPSDTSCSIRYSKPQPTVNPTSFTPSPPTFTLISKNEQLAEKLQREVA